MINIIKINLCLALLISFCLFIEFTFAKNNFQNKLGLATFAGGCFWCMEPPFESLSGVKSVISGYAGGTKKNPSYEEVSAGKTKHVEAIQIQYDPKLITYQRLLEIYWQNIDPTDPRGQFVDKGKQYLSKIFYHDETQKSLAEKSIKDLEKKGKFSKKIVTAVLSYTTFYPAEDYHQDYYKKNLTSSIKYKYYREKSGRDQYINSKWKNEGYKMNDDLSSKYTEEVIKNGIKKLDKLEVLVTQKDGTEPPFKNKYNDNKEEGIYVDIVSGEPLFASIDKYDSKSGWPSFTKPIDAHFIIEKEDKKLFRTRVEVRSRYASSHLGHVFNDGPAPTGLRYCINSSSLRFIPKSELKGTDLEKYLSLFVK